jgi:predicted TIM-barrel fold metal-dependent hydrolase
MELDGCLDPYFEARLLKRFHALPYLHAKDGDLQWSATARRQQADATFRDGEDANILLRKDYEAMGAFLPADRPRALDLLGFASQLVFTTYCLGNFGLDQSDDMELCYAAADAHNRMMTDFCARDRRLLPTAYIPLEDFERAAASTALALKLGAKGLTIPSRVPQHHAPSHIAFDAVWAQAAEAGVPILFHVGGELKMDPAYVQNGLPRIRDFHGGEENFTSLTYMAIPHSVEQSLAALILDGVLDRFPALKVGVIELGASWLPGWMRYLDAGAAAFIKNEDRLKRLSAKPSEIVRRQVHVTPYPHEDTGWIIAQAGEEVCLFSSDYPHVEGGRNPLKRFDESLSAAGTSDHARQRFYAENFIDLMGTALAEDLRRPLPKQVAA